MNGNDLAHPSGEVLIRISGGGSESIIAASGRLTVDSSPLLRSPLLSLIRRSSGQAVVIDLSEVSYLDTSGIATLLEALSSAHEYSVRLRLIGIQGQPRSLAELAELSGIFQALGSQVEFT